MRPYLYSLCWLSLLLVACGSPAGNTGEDAGETSQFTVQNPLDVARQDALLRLAATELNEAFPETDWSAVKFTNAGTSVPFQANDLDGDGATDEFVLVLSMGPKEEKSIAIEALGEGEAAPAFTKRTQAELSHKVNGHWEGREYIDGEFQNVDYLRVPPEHTDHSWFIRYEGPGWESDMVGYRFYLDWRNATDIFGKKTSDMVLQGVGQDGFDSYHEPADWGMDILKVGESLGIGSLGTWLGDKALRVETTDSLSSEIVLNGTQESMVRTMYYGWQVGEVKTDVTSELSIHAGSRLTRHHVQLSTDLPNLCTGIVKHENAELFSKLEGEWGYIANWGEQSLAEDELGMAVLFRTGDFAEVTEDEHSHVVVLKPDGGEVTYYFLAAWVQERDGIQTQAQFKSYLDATTAELATALEVSF